MKRSDIVELVVLAALWGASFLFLRMGAAEFGPVALACVRVVGASCFLLPLLAWRGEFALLRRHWRPLLVVGITNSALPFLCFSFAALSITAGLSAIFNATTPLFGALFASLWLKDKLTPQRMLGLGVGFAGVLWLVADKASFKPGAGSTGWAVLACLLACICYGISASYTKRYLSGLNPLVTAAGSQVGATLGLALPALWLWPAHMPGSTAWLALLAVGVLCTGLAYSLFFRLIENAGPQRALSVTFLVPVFAVLYGVLFLGEAVTGWMVVCAAVIVCGTALSTGLLKLGARQAQ